MEPENRARITQEIWAIEGRAVTPNAGADRMAARTANTRSGSVSIVPETLWCRAAWKPGAEAWDGCWESMTGRLAGRRPADWEACRLDVTGGWGERLRKIATPGGVWEWHNHQIKATSFVFQDPAWDLKILKHTESMSGQFLLSSLISRPQKAPRQVHSRFWGDI